VLPKNDQIVHPGGRDAIRLPREAVDAAIIELFEEVQILDDVSMEEWGFTCRAARSPTSKR
jgi:hypothetical protein